MPDGEQDHFSALTLELLRPYLSITILECCSEDPDTAFESLRRFLRRTAGERGQALAVRTAREIDLRDHAEIGAFGVDEDWGIDAVFGLFREVRRSPGWAVKEAGLVDVLNQLTLALRRNNLVALWTEITTDSQLSKWIQRGAAPYRFLPPDVLAGTFDGDGKMIWTRGIHRRRTSKADTKVLGGIRLQDALDGNEDGTYVWTAAKVDYQPEDDAAVFRRTVTISPERSHISWKRTPDLSLFLAATTEALDMLDKALVAEEPPDPLFPILPTKETDLGRVRGAFDLSVADPDQVRGEPDVDDDRIERAESLQAAVISVDGDPGSAETVIEVGERGSVAGRLWLKPVKTGTDFGLEVGFGGVPSLEPFARQVRDAVAPGDLVTIYYESGHVYNGRQIYRQSFGASPFTHFVFDDFAGINVTKEKPAVKGDQAIHDAIGDDDSLFTWVVRHFSTGWLLCDDGAGEVADFLHLADDGTLTAIHVKGAANGSVNRRIAVQPFEQVASQAVKNVRQLYNEVLTARLSRPRIARPGAWHDGERVSSGEFVNELSLRVASDNTIVMIVQPHLLHGPYVRARNASEAGHPARDSFSLALLDTLMHSTRRAITSHCEDLVVVGAR